MLDTMQSRTLSSHLLSKIVKIGIYKTIILHVVLYGCVTWSLMLRGELRPMVFKNRVLRIFGLKRDEVAGGWKERHNEELRNLCSSPSIVTMKSRRVRWAGAVDQMGEKRNAYRILVGKPEGKRSLRRPKCRWVDSIKMDLRMGWYGLDQCGLG
jgi:hypothetical protein